ncbi:DUF5984 family protein [Silvimonas sp.]|uniref:DUF5984 family protein n=1 Tax=Silvimonas sp. TaxID=2650811 RepID=UPI0028415275|nr:DUF5984 family protein [Silvimonas sp.]MDR3427012.1 DUF5984 family protein [Silvimonas sp.]
MLINFSLVPVEKIRPWGTPGAYRLHWFGLTDGEYWIQAGEAALFEHSDDAQTAGAGRYCDYQVVRLYEDLMEMLPYILEPIPKSLTQYICGETANAWQKTCNTWCDKSYDVLESSRFDETYNAAVAWTGKRWLDSAYLSPSANIAIWSDEEYVHIEWDNRDRRFNGKPAWSAILGSYKMPRNEFIKEMKSFHLRLMEQMATRVIQAEKGALAPGIEIDLPCLVKEQERRIRTLDTSLNLCPKTDWKEVEKAIREIREA